MKQNDLEYINGKGSLDYLDRMASSNDYADPNDISYSVIHLKQLLLERQKYKKLEERIGCPFEVYIGILLREITTIFCEDGYKYEIQSDTIRKNGFFAYGNHKLISKFFEGYKKNWWTKADRSE